jgi:Glycosyl transferase family group 2
MRLQIAGFEIRMANYHGDEFKEGVSVTVFDEVARWQKYAYGTNELIFNPIRYWYKGPFTSLYINYLLSSVKPASKISLISYTFTYYALAMALPLAILNYFLFGLWPDTLDQFFVASWKVLVVILSIFYVIVSIPYLLAINQSVANLTRHHSHTSSSASVSVTKTSRLPSSKLSPGPPSLPSSSPASPSTS